MNRYSLLNLKGQYTAKQLVTVARTIKMEPDATFTVGTDWPGREQTGEEWMNWFRSKLMEKINSHEPQTGRKRTYEYELELNRIRQYIGNRIVIRYVPKILGERVKNALQHRFPDPDDYR